MAKLPGSIFVGQDESPVGQGQGAAGRAGERNLPARAPFPFRGTKHLSRRIAMRRILPVLAVLGTGLGACGGATMVEPPDRIVYLAIGGSDVAGVDADPLTRGYVFRIAEELDERVDQVFLTPLAVPNGPAEQIDTALELILDSGLEPNLVTLWTGPNDVIRGEDVDDFEDELEDIFGRLRDRTDGVIVAANVPDLTELPRFRDDPDDDVTQERIEAFNEMIAEQAEDYDVLVVDLFGEPVEDDLVSDADGFHPNNEGHRRIAEQFLEVILPALGLEPST
jgi:lysophospholipase L1-like esterase